MGFPLSRNRKLIGQALFATAMAAFGAFNSRSVVAHDFQMRYDLPIPFDLYLYACAVALVVTFVLFGWFMKLPAAATTGRIADADGRKPVARIPRWTLGFLRTVALVCLGLTIVIGLFGTRDPDENVSLTLFWQVFLLGFTYLTALIGDVYAFANPWKSIVDWVQAHTSGAARPRFAYPPGLAYWPAVIFYIALIWFELFSHPRPRVLAVVLIVYSLMVFIGVWLFGKTAWFRYGDIFGVFLRVVGMLAPLSYHPTPDGKSFSVFVRWPFVGLLEERPEHLSLVVFVLFMLASTTYDGMHQTVFWMGLYYNHLLQVLHPLWGTDMIAVQATLETWYVVYQRIGLVLSPFLYLAIYLGVLSLVKATTKTVISLRTLALEFAFSIVPIAFVYNLAHYYTFVLSRAPNLPYLLSDPFALGWNPFGFTPPSNEPPVFNMAAVWHTEVALILIGHVVSVYLAHRVALRLFASRREAMVSQIPMLLLMVSYTVLGLWVISLPFALI